MKIDRTGKVAYWCKTKELAKEFLKECDEQGIVWWNSKKKASDELNYNYGTQTSYCADEQGLSFASKDYCERGELTVIEYKGKNTDEIITAEVATESVVKTTAIKQIRELISDLSTLIATRKRIKSEIVRTGIDEEIKRVKAILVDNIVEI